jgi:1,4-alpha-glucan branching enzyme
VKEVGKPKEKRRLKAPDRAVPENPFERLVRGEDGDPFAILGQHPMDGGKGKVIRVFAPDAARIDVLADQGASVAPMHRIHRQGLFDANFPQRGEAFPYKLRIVDKEGRGREIEDPYVFPSLLTEFDLHLIGEGTHYGVYEKLGAHLREVDGSRGVHFAVWAPNARRVSVVGDFNRWDGRVHPMRLHPGNGIWEIFIPGLDKGTLYKFEVLPKWGPPALKADPFAFTFELPPRTASVVSDLAYEWGDEAWMTERAMKQTLDAPLAIYEVHLGSWRRVPEEGHRVLTYRELGQQMATYLKEMGYTHVELLPITEHPYYPSWGYQALGYFAPTRRYGSPQDFMNFVDTMHQHGIGVILDWVPAHFPQDPHGLIYFDGSHLYEHEDPRLREQPDWGTRVFNYGRNEVADFLITSALFWLDRYHIDGLRLDAVASMLYLDYSRKQGDWAPNKYGGNENLAAIAFLKRFNEVVYQRHPGVMTFAEESTAWPMVSRPVYLGGLGFGYKWNMGWMHDTLTYISKEPIHRKYHHHDLTFGLLYAWHENFILPLSHDEVVHGKGSLYAKMPGDDWQKAANLRLYFTFMYGHPGKKLLFMGGEFGQTSEWYYDASLDWHLLEMGPYHRGLQRLVQDLNRLYKLEPSLHQVDFEPAGFQWIDCNDWEGSVICFLRRARDPEDCVIFVCNFTPVVRHRYRIGVRRSGYYQEIINSDAAIYGGSNVGNAGGLRAEPIPWQGCPWSISATLPPLGALALKWVSE